MKREIRIVFIVIEKFPSSRKRLAQVDNGSPPLAGLGYRL
jgi:hypothetical protein